jgi:hypothetical protein
MEPAILLAPAVVRLLRDESLFACLGCRLAAGYGNLNLTKQAHQFLNYLNDEESREIAEFDLETRGDVWQQPFVPEIKLQIEKEFAWIDRRLRENREKYAEELTAPEEPQVDAIDEDESDNEEEEIPN